MAKGCDPVGALAALALLAPAAPRAPTLGANIIERCTHGQSLGGFSQQAYRQALAEMPAEVNEYSECATLIRKAELAAAGRGGAARPPRRVRRAVSAPASPPPSPAEQQALQAAHTTAGAAPVNVGGQPVVPGVVHADIASAVSSLPTPLLARAGIAPDRRRGDPRARDPRPCPRTSRGIATPRATATPPTPACSTGLPPTLGTRRSASGHSG